MEFKTITGLWKISPGADADGWGDCLKNGIIGIGWAHEKEDLHGLTKEEIIEYTRENWDAIKKPGYIASQLIDFIFNIQKGHIIVAYSAPSTIYGVGIVEKKGWKHNKDVGKAYWQANTRKVNWVKPFLKTKIDDPEIKSVLGKRDTILPIPKLFFIKKLLPLFSKQSNEINESLIKLEVGQNVYSSIEEDEQLISDESLEEKKKLRFHKSVERNPDLSKKAKEIHGYTCKACGFNFEEKYGEIGINYIEAHHIIPFAELEENAKVSPRKDMTVLCANCHRMIHRSKNTLNRFKMIIH